MGLGPLHPGREGKGRMGWEGRELREGEGKEGEGDEISIHGLKLVAPPMPSCHCKNHQQPILPTLQL